MDGPAGGNVIVSATEAQTHDALNRVEKLAQA
jgi:hypothetical protein